MRRPESARVKVISRDSIFLSQHDSRHQQIDTTHTPVKEEQDSSVDEEMNSEQSQSRKLEEEGNEMEDEEALAEDELTKTDNRQDTTTIVVQEDITTDIKSLREEGRDSTVVEPEQRPLPNLAEA